MESLKRKLKDWEDRFYIKYNRPATREDIKNYPKVEQVYQQLKSLKKEKELILQPSPFKKKSGGLLKTLSSSNVTGKSCSFTDRLLAAKSEEKENQSGNQVNKHKVEIEQDNNSGVSDSIVIKRFLESGKRSWTMPKPKLERKPSLFNFKKTSSVLLDNPLVSSTSMEKLKEPQTKVVESVLQEPDRMLVQDPISVDTKEEIHFDFKVVRPNKNIASKTFKRHSSYSFTQLPSNYKDFLTKEEESRLAHIIDTVAGKINENRKDAVVDSSTPKEDSEVETEEILEPETVHTFSDVADEPETVSASVDPEVITRKKRKSTTDDPAKRTKTKVETGNFRSMNLKSKGKGTTVQKGNKFKKQSKLQSYNYQRSKKDSILDGYEEEYQEIEEVETNSTLELNCEFTVPDETERTTNVNGTIVDLHIVLKSLTNNDSFKNGQKETIEKILLNHSSLLVLPTGGGKSLCYQIPAFIFKNIFPGSLALVISPTISLMQDQLKCLPPGLRGACFNSWEKADSLAQYLRIRNFDAESYHAGRTIQDRQATQARFMRGKVPIIIATVAFGLGINKSDVDAIIHYSLPKTLENYVQEIGRAGRNGSAATCHLFLSREDYIKHRSFSFSDSVNSTNLNNFLIYLYQSKKELFSVFVQECEKKFDMKETVISTILSYIQLSNPDDLVFNPSIDGVYTLYFTNKFTLEQMVQEYPEFERLPEVSYKSKGGIEFEIAQIGNNHKDLASVLWSLQARKLIRFKGDKKIFQVELKKNVKNVQEHATKLIESIYPKLMHIQESRIAKLDLAYDCFNQVASEKEGQALMNQKLADYFSTSAHVSEGITDPVLSEKHKIMELNIEISIKQFVKEHLDQIDSGICHLK
ncbi:hypothetical protein HK103_004316 [Boothiomyces macroporosus]|uniref:DNA 3'-5' helicase n=1 Tax=Boothiomyces macroporosus TaxID=261099 RepID=A0AAD5UL18_9FUNG|nr:hypothetical protein HK103_004316 [Boothiomyces macroporosus]